MHSRARESVTAAECRPNSPVMEKEMTVSTDRSDPGHATPCHSAVPLWRRPIIWVALGAVALAALAINWNWLLAAGAVPILLAVLPCGIMCLFHLCSGGKKPAAN